MNIFKSPNKFIKTSFILVLVAMFFSITFGLVYINTENFGLGYEIQEQTIAKNIQDLQSEVLGVKSDLSKEKLIDNIKNSILPSGALAMYPIKNLPTNSKAIVPYWSNLAVCGMATEIKYGDYWDKKGLEYLAWNILDWYKYRQNPRTGYVTDYNYDKTTKKETSTGDMDSVDSYSATYLKALECLYTATGNKTKLLQHKSSSKLAYKSILSVMDIDNLTFAKPTYRVKYLMDNVEVLAGVKSYKNLLGVYGSTQNEVSQMVDKVELAIEAKMWNKDAQNYYWAIAGSGKNEYKYTTDWKIYYPDALENIWYYAFADTETLNPKNTKNTTNLNNSKKTNDQFLVGLDGYKDNGHSGSWNPFVPLSVYNYGRKTEAREIFNYGLNLANSDKLGGIYTSGHSGIFLITYYKLNGDNSVF